MDKLKDRYFIRLYQKDDFKPQRLPLASARTLFRVFIHFIAGDYVSLEVYREDYLSKRVCNVKTNSAGISTAERITMRAKMFEYFPYDDIVNKFSEGLYDPEESGEYQSGVMKIAPFNEEQFENAIELLSIINEEGSI
jgi:hypothetical protein